VSDVPRIISVDDHIVEPRDLWERYLPERFRDRGPRVRKLKGRFGPGRSMGDWVEDDEGQWSDVWVYEDLKAAILPGFAMSGHNQDDISQAYKPMDYDEMRPGAYDQAARLVDMDANHTEASLCFPTFPRFCGQTFLERGDREMGLACVQAFNDWMIDEWCAGAGRGRLIPLFLVPLWSPDLAADEVRRCNAKGAFAVAFSEEPSKLGLPSIHTDHWDPFFAACDESGTVINMHIGSSSKMAEISPGAPRATGLSLTYEGAAHALAEWLTSGLLERFGRLRIALSEGQIGWMPFLLERLDGIWHQRPGYGHLDTRLHQAPSAYLPDRVFGCIFDDLAGLRLRDVIGVDQIMFETDYPHGDSTWPESRAVLDRLVKEADLSEDEVYRVVRGNAIRCYGLDRIGVAH
jgi:predicted TIM-barrel fold metal-dependent hydrolase